MAERLGGSQVTSTQSGIYAVWVGIELEALSFALVFLPGFGMQRYPSPPVNTTRLTTAAATAKPHFLPLTSGDSIRASVSHLLTRAFSLPCSTAALAFTQLVQPTSRFQLALDALLPLLDSNTTAEVRVFNLQLLPTGADAGFRS